MTRNIQLYINEKLSEKELVKTLSTVTGIELESLNYPSDMADGFVMITQYEKGFSLNVNIMWPDSLEVNVDELNVAEYLSRKYNTLVATDPPDFCGDSICQDPFTWYVFSPVEKPKLYNQSIPDEGYLLLSEPLVSNGKEN